MKVAAVFCLLAGFARGDLEARVAALEAQVVALQSELSAQQTEVSAVQKEVTLVETQVVQVGSNLTNLTGQYHGTVKMVKMLEIGLTTEITRLNETEVHLDALDGHVTDMVGIFNTSLTTIVTRANQTDAGLASLGDSVTGVNGTVQGNMAAIGWLKTATHRDRLVLASTTELANKTMLLLTELSREVAAINITLAENVVVINKTAEEVLMNKKMIEEEKFHIQKSEKAISHLQFGMADVHKRLYDDEADMDDAQEAINHIETEELKEVHEKAQRNAEKISHNEETLEEHFTEIGYNKEGVSKNLGDIETMNSQMEDLDRTLKSAETKIKDNKEGVSKNGDSVEDIRKTLAFVKTEVVEYCGYQSSWNKQDHVLTYEYLTVSRDTVEPNQDSAPQGGSPNNRPIPGLNKASGKFLAPIQGTFRVSFQVGQLETPSEGEHRSSVYIRKNELKDASLHLMTVSRTKESDVIGHEVLLSLEAGDQLDVFVDQTTNNFYDVTLCVALV